MSSIEKRTSSATVAGELVALSGWHLPHMCQELAWDQGNFLRLLLILRPSSARTIPFTTHF